MRPDRPALAAAAVFLVALAYRLYAILVTVPEPTGDESLVGIVALHIASGRDHPSYFYGQHYMGALEAYLSAPFVGVFGPSIPTVRMGTLLLYVGFFWATYWWTRRVLSPWFAVVTLAFLSFGSDRVLRNELQANGGYGEMLFFGALLAALVAAASLPGLVTRRRRLVFGAWGLVAGAALWSDPLIAPYIAVLGLALFALRWREFFGWGGLALAGGALIGLAPAIVHNLSLPPGVGTINDLRTYNVVEVPAGITWHHHLTGVLQATGLSTGMCDIYGCTDWRLWWSWAFVGLILVAIVMGTVALLRRVTGPARVRAALLVALGLGAVLTMGIYGRSAHSVGDVTQSARYVSNLLISVPAALWPVWVAVRAPFGRAARRSRARLGPAIAGATAGIAALGLLAFTIASATVFVFTTSLPQAQMIKRHDRGVVEALDQLGVGTFYSDFFLCHRVMYVTNERLLCASMLDDLTTGWNRYLPFRDAVQASARPAYVLVTNSEMERAFVEYLRLHGLNAKITEIDNYRIYQMPAKIPVPS